MKLSKEFLLICNYLNDLDKGIRRLVIELNFLGIKTESSCEGHNSDWHYSFPWVCIDSGCYLQSRKIISEYNTISDFQWSVKIHKPSKKWVIRPKSVDRSLDQLHQEVILLANFLSEKRKKERQI